MTSVGAYRAMTGYLISNPTLLGYRSGNDSNVMIITLSNDRSANESGMLHSNTPIVDGFTSVTTTP